MLFFVDFTTSGVPVKQIYVLACLNSARIAI